MSINVIIFSKDRPLQVEACLRSFYNFFIEHEQAKATVIYKASSQAFEDAYKTLQGALTHIKGVSFVREMQPLKTIITNVMDKQNPYTMFLVDDIIFRDFFSLNDPELKMLNYPGVMNLSLRLDKNITHCYAINATQKIPQMKKKCVWDWTKAEGDWNYPMSVDGNIFKTHLISEVIGHVDFNNPNVFEAVMDRYAKTILQNQYPYMCCYVERSKLLNVPANRVQNNVNNRVENSFMPEALLIKFNQGYIIDISGAIDAHNTSCHWPMEYKFVK